MFPKVKRPVFFSITISLVLLTSPLFSWSAPLDSSGLGNIHVQSGSEEANHPSSGSKKTFKKIVTNDNLQVKKIETQIKAINLIVSTEKNKDKKNDLFLRRAQMQLSVAKALGLNRSSVAQMTAEEKQYLQASQKTLLALQGIWKNEKKKLADTYYLLGLIDYEYDDMAAVKKNFYEALRLYPQHSYATSMAIVLGEIEYDGERFLDAIQIYQRLYKRYTAKEKALADYKTAWSYVGMNDYDNARVYFLRIIQNKQDPDFMIDTIKDLAFLSVQEWDENQVIAYGNQKIADLKDRSLYYYHAITQFLVKDKKTKRENLFLEVQKIETDPVQKARIYYLKVQYERSEIPTFLAYQAMLQLNQYLTNLDNAHLSQFLLQDGKRLEEDSEAIIKNFIDAYSGKVQKPDNMTQANVIESAKKLIAIHLRVFPDSSKKELIYTLWIDACMETKDEATLASLKNQFAKQNKKPPYTQLYNQAFLKQIVLMDDAYTKNPEQNAEKLTNLILQFLKEFPGQRENFKIRKKLAAIYIKNELHAEALPFVEAVYKEEPQTENLNRLLYVQYKLGMYQDVVKNGQAAKESNSEIQDLVRESNLKLAQKSIDEGAFNEYEKHIQKFLQSNPSDEKAVVAYQDYFQRILSQQKLQVFLTEWKKMKPTLQGRSDFFSIRQQAISVLFVLGQNLLDSTLFKPSNNAELQYTMFLYELGHPTKQGVSLRRDMPVLSREKRNYILKTLSLTSPQAVIDFMNSQKSLTHEEKSILLDAVLLVHQQDFLHFVEDSAFSGFVQTKQFAQLREFFPTQVLPKPKSKFLVQLKTYIVPTAKTSSGKYSQMVETLAKNLRFMRKKTPSELTKISSTEQMELLTVLTRLEKSTGEAILNSPLPSNLTAEQTEEYKKGLADLAAEFERQAAEYSSALDVIKTQRDAERANQEKDLVRVEAEQLPKPKNTEELALALKVSKQNLTLGLLHLDAVYAQKRIEELDYDLIKTHVLLSHNSSIAMKSILGRDLRAQNKQSLLDEMNAKAK